VLQNPNVACAIIGASRPRQINENVAASGVVLTPEVMSRIDDALGDVVVRNPMLTVENSPKGRPS
jgi:aryl-alcohol dehydrogenase-like predicted oxidoreductase